jgi:hypothetical protein
LKLNDLLAQQQSGDNSPLLAANIKTASDRFEELRHRLDTRRSELNQERHCTISDIKHIGRAWVLPHPERTKPDIAPLIRDDEIEKIAVQEAIKYEEARGFKVESVEKENRGFDLISRRYHPEDPKTAIEIHFIEVKGRAGVGEIALSPNEYNTAQRLKKDYWLYVVYNCANRPEVHIHQDPAKLGWEMVETVVHYKIGSNKILEGKRQ